MKYIEPRTQSVFVILTNQILFFICLSTMFKMWMIVPLFITLHTYGMFWEVAMHRYWGHHAFDTSRPKELVLYVWAFLTGQGSIISWVNVHRHHHKHEDTELDPHSPLHESKWRICTGLFTNRCERIMVRDLIRSKDIHYLIFENRYYAFMWIALWIISFLIHPLFFFWIVSGSAMWWLATVIINIVAHGRILGQQRFPESVANNSSILNAITGMGNHNNHHKYPNSYTFTIDKEIDIHGWIIKRFLKVKSQ